MKSHPKESQVDSKITFRPPYCVWELARCSKCDFWIPGKISNWYRKKSTKKNKVNNFHVKIEKHFRDQQIFEKKKLWKSQYEKFENFDFFAIFFSRNFRFFNIDFSMKIFGFRKNLKKYFFEIFRKIFWSREKIFFIWKKSTPTPNFPRNPKITLRKSYDHLKYTKT